MSANPHETAARAVRVLALTGQISLVLSRELDNSPAYVVRLVEAFGEREWRSFARHIGIGAPDETMREMVREHYRRIARAWDALHRRCETEIERAGAAVGAVGKG